MLSLALRIAKLARLKKADKVAVLDMRSVSASFDYFVIMSGNSLRQVNALAEAIQEDLFKDRIKPLSKVSATDESGWVALDYASVVVHIFYKPMREFYSLERLWSDAKRVRIPSERKPRQKTPSSRKRSNKRA
ncbi:MAG: ribosome silencing factor [Candidatus Omnitrophota bacterium]